MRPKLSILHLILFAVIPFWAGISPVFAADSTIVDYSYETLPGVELNLFVSTAKVVLALAFTLFLLVAAVWLMKRFMQIRNIPGMTGSNVDVLEIRYLGPRKSIALIQVAGRVLIVGLTDQTMTTLGELSVEEAAGLAQAPSPSQGGFSAILGKFMKKEN